MRRVIFGALVLLLTGCGGTETAGDADTMQSSETVDSLVDRKADSIIVDCNYTFEEAVSGSRAPQELLDRLALYDVLYYSTDGRMHRGQMLSDTSIVQDMQELFAIMREEHFVIEKVIPVVRYNWDDEASMADNNSYCFCFRDASYSFHSVGLAVDINPYFNPQRWKGSYRQMRQDKPVGAVYAPSRPGTFIVGSRIVEEFRKRGFRWGHYMSRKSDDHHFQKAALSEMPKGYRTVYPKRDEATAAVPEKTVSSEDIPPTDLDASSRGEDRLKTAREKIKERARRGKELQ